MVTADDIEDRNPIILSKQAVNISEDGLALLRKSPKFCPTPGGPTEEMEHYKAFLRFQQNLRWKWFFNKNKDTFNLDDDFQSKPWDTKTERSAPTAHDAPELEAFLAGIEKAIRNPNLRRKIKSNLNENQIEFINELKKNYPAKGLRIRREDKGARFVIEDAVTEDNRIIGNLSNPVQYTQTEVNPMDTYVQEIKQWADAALENNEIDEKQFKYVTNIDETHLAIPKPLYKTHKTDIEGNM